MITKEILQKFIDLHKDEIGEVTSKGLKDKSGKWILVCPIIERFDLDFSGIDCKKAEKEEVVEEVKPEKKTKKSKKK